MSDHGAVDLFLNDVMKYLDVDNFKPAILYLARAVKALAERPQPATENYGQIALDLCNKRCNELEARMKKALAILKLRATRSVLGTEIHSELNKAIAILEGAE